MKRSHGHQVGITAGVEKIGPRFKACVGAAKHKVCSWHRNPRLALAGALSTLSKTLRKRTGIFAGMR